MRQRYEGKSSDARASMPAAVPESLSIRGIRGCLSASRIQSFLFRPFSAVLPYLLNTPAGSMRVTFRIAVMAAKMHMPTVSANK